MNVNTNWSLVVDKNPDALIGFVNGDSLRKTIHAFDCPDARTELYRLEKNSKADSARKLARKALARRNYI